MSRWGSVCLCAIVALVALLGAAFFHPVPVLADSGTLKMETPLHDSPDPSAPVIALLPEGSAVAIAGPPVDGFYPVIAGNLSGWMRGETLSLEKETPDSVAAEDVDGDPPVDDTADTAPAALDPAIGTAAAQEEIPLVTQSAREVGTPPVLEAVPVEDPSLMSDPAPEDAATPEGAVAASESEPGSAGISVPVGSGAATPPLDVASAPEAVAAAPPLDPNVTPIPAAKFAA